MNSNLILSILFSSFLITFCTALTGEWKACNGQPGVCIDTSQYTCTSSTVSGLCKGPANVRCCIAQAGVNSEKCSRAGGTCKRTTDCGNTSMNGLCPGPTSIKCCATSNFFSFTSTRVSSGGEENLNYNCSSVWMSKAGKTFVNGQWKISMLPSTRARLSANRESSWRSIYSDLQVCVPFPPLNSSQKESVFEQLACHAKWVKLPIFGGRIWDYEANRPPIGLRNAIGRFFPPRHRCNWK